MTLFSRVCTTAFLHDQKKLLKTHRAVLAARRTSQSFASWRHRHNARRARSPPSTLFTTIRRRRSRPFAADCRSLMHMTSDQIEQYSRDASLETMADRPLNASHGADSDTNLNNQEMGTSHESAAKPRANCSAHKQHSSTASFPSYSSSRPSSIDARIDNMPPPPTPSEDPAVNRSSRSTSSASRNTNRLSITLPIAPPTADPSRPAPSSATATYPSVPGTPVRQTPSSLNSPTDANELIIAIAAQERRVLELREELGRAEDDLKKIKRQWSLHEAYKKSSDRKFDSTRPASSQADAVPGTPVDARRKLLLQTQGTPRDERKRVFSGRHTRTLSLLSPTKPPEEPFAVHEDRPAAAPVPAAAAIPGPENRPAVVRRQAALNKRATWQPHQFSHAHSSSLNAQLQNPMSQIVEDFKLGFRTFYEDIRQITVGDEPVNGVNGAAPGARPTGAPSAAQPGPQRTHSADDQDTIRPSPAPRPKLEAAFEYPDETPSKAPRAPADSSAAAAPQRERNARARNKHFSWTPLSFDGIDGDAWLTFDSPASAGKSTRWSGSTMNEEEKTQEVDSPL